MKAILLSGISGSGKTTYAENVLKDHPDGTICSADHWFERSGTYVFDRTQLSAAHAACFKRFVESLRDGRMTGVPDPVICCNTNLSLVELSPYVLACNAYGYEFEVVTVLCDVEKAAARNVHGVPANKVKQQAERLAKRTMPKEWKQKVVNS